MRRAVSLGHSIPSEASPWPQFRAPDAVPRGGLATVALCGPKHIRSSAESSAVPPSVARDAGPQSLRLSHRKEEEKQ